MSGVPDDVRADAIPFQTLMRAGRLFQAISLVARDRECVLLIAQELHRAARPSVQPEPLTAREEAERDVLAERERQKAVEGWPPEHDDDYAHFELARAASCYAAEAAEPTRRPAEEGDRPYNWPWHSEWWKPSGRRRNLVKAGALILAEIERIDRAADRQRSRATPPEKGETE